MNTDLEKGCQDVKGLFSSPIFCIQLNYQRIRVWWLARTTGIFYRPFMGCNKKKNLTQSWPSPKSESKQCCVHVATSGSKTGPTAVTRLENQCPEVEAKLGITQWANHRMHGRKMFNDHTGPLENKSSSTKQQAGKEAAIFGSAFPARLFRLVLFQFSPSFSPF